MTDPVDRESTTWIKAAASMDSGNCVQMRRNADMVEIRDSKDPNGPILRFTGAEFAAWLDGATRGEFTHLQP